MNVQEVRAMGKKIQYSILYSVENHSVDIQCFITYFMNCQDN